MISAGEHLPHQVPARRRAPAPPFPSLPRRAHPLSLPPLSRALARTRAPARVPKLFEARELCVSLSMEQICFVSSGSNVLSAMVGGVFALIAVGLLSWLQPEASRRVAGQREEVLVRRTKQHDKVFVTEFGECYHGETECKGLRSAKAVKALRPCKVCDPLKRRAVRTKLENARCERCEDGNRTMR